MCTISIPFVDRIAHIMTNLTSLPVEIKEHIVRCINSRNTTASDPWLFEHELDRTTRHTLLNLAKVGNHSLTELALKYLYAYTIFKFEKPKQSFAERFITKLYSDPRPNTIDGDETVKNRVTDGQLQAIELSTKRPHLRYCDYVHHIGRCDPPLQPYITKWCRRLLSSPPTTIPFQDPGPRLVIPATWEFVWRDQAENCITSKTRVSDVPNRFCDRARRTGSY